MDPVLDQVFTEDATLESIELDLAYLHGWQEPTRAPRGIACGLLLSMLFWVPLAWWLL